jgi:hypothetical protein
MQDWLDTFVILQNYLPHSICRNYTTLFINEKMTEWGPSPLYLCQKKLLFIFRGMYSKLMVIMPKLQDNEVQFTVQSDRTRLTNVITFVFM